MNKFKDIISELLVTCFFIGKIKHAPGTFGSLAAFPLTYCIMTTLINTRFLLPIQGFSEVEREFITITVFMFSTIVILSIIGVIASNYYMKNKGVHDPKEIVIDELVGQMLTSSMTMVSIVFVYNSSVIQSYNKLLVDWMCFFILPFVLFRACDIIKPWPIRWIDQNVKGGIGVMMDDIAAAILATVLQYALIFAFIG
jgi:phosphatidylglycerophosphatase A